MRADDARAPTRVVSAIAFRTERDYQAAVPVAVEHLRRGLVVAHPTETVYGLGSILDPAALQRVAALKGRAAEKPFVVLATGLEMIQAIGLSLPSHATRLAERFWPGALTLVLPRALQTVQPERGGPSGVAVRWTSHPGIQALIHALGAPITSTSANRAGLPPARSAGEIVSRWSAETSSGDLLVLDGGTLDDLAPSTIVDCSSHSPRVLRGGAIAVSALREIVPGLIEE